MGNLYSTNFCSLVYLTRGGRGKLAVWGKRKKGKKEEKEEEEVKGGGDEGEEVNTVVTRKKNLTADNEFQN